MYCTPWEFPCRGILGLCICKWGARNLITSKCSNIFLYKKKKLMKFCVFCFVFKKERGGKERKKPNSVCAGETRPSTEWEPIATGVCARLGSVSATQQVHLDWKKGRLKCHCTRVGWSRAVCQLALLLHLQILQSGRWGKVRLCHKGARSWWQEDTACGSPIPAHLGACPGWRGHRTRHCRAANLFFNSDGGAEQACGCLQLLWAGQRLGICCPSEYIQATITRGFAAPTWVSCSLGHWILSP